MKRNFITAVLMTIVTTVLLGIIYPLAVTGLAQLLFHDKANGQLIAGANGPIGSRIIGQPFVSDKYFHSRPSAAGNGYDAANSSAIQFWTDESEIDRPGEERHSGLRKRRIRISPFPLISVTTSASGLDPDITPAAALFQVPRIARVRGLTEDRVRALVESHIEQRQLGFLGEPRVNVLELNLALDQVGK